MIHVVTRENAHLYTNELRRMHEMRHEVFVEEMGWEDLRSDDGLERDQFDTRDAVYLLLIEEGVLIGSHRLIPTMKPHLFSDIFPHLCDVRGVVRSNKVYELNRTCVDTVLLGPKGSVRARKILMTGLMEFCVRSGMDHFTVLSKVDILERYTRIGWTLRPLGVPVIIDGGPQVAVQVKTDQAALTVMQQACRIREQQLDYIGGSVEIEDLLPVLQEEESAEIALPHQISVFNRTSVIPESAADDFARDGVVCLREVLDLQQVRDLTAELDRLSAAREESAAGYDMTDLQMAIFGGEGQVDTGGVASQHDISGIAQFIRASGKKPLLDEVSSGKRGHFTLDTSTWKRSEAIRKLALDSVLPSVAAQLMRSAKVNYYDDQIFVKEPHTAERTAMHQDYTYFNLKGWAGCVMWICVDAANRKSGAPIYLAGSHKWDKEFAPNVFLSQTKLPGSVGEALDQIEAETEKYDVRSFDVLPGDIIIHHFRTVHGAGGNLSNRPRRALSLRYVGDDMLYYSRPGAPPPVDQHHALKEGDILDSPDFPVVWPRPFPGFQLSSIYEGIGKTG
jgi:N-acyl-L-homoserine lactone synthetase/ectoine hydroxylase-related dioxygenase (phytanoyl-CoA dioxygenase family)